PGDSEALPLSAGEIGAALGYPGMQSHRQPVYKISLGNRKDMPHFLLRSLFISLPQILRNCSRKQPCLLRYIGNMPAQLFLLDFPDILPACQHLTLRHIMETEQKLCNSRFSASGSSYYRCRLPSLTGKTNIFQCLFIC